MYYFLLFCVNVICSLRKTNNSLSVIWHKRYERYYALHYIVATIPQQKCFLKIVARQIILVIETIKKYVYIVIIY